MTEDIPLYKTSTDLQRTGFPEDVSQVDCEWTLKQSDQQYLRHIQHTIFTRTRDYNEIDVDHVPYIVEKHTGDQYLVSCLVTERVNSVAKEETRAYHQKQRTIPYQQPLSSRTHIVYLLDYVVALLRNAPPLTTGEWQGWHRKIRADRKNKEGFFLFLEFKYLGVFCKFHISINKFEVAWHVRSVRRAWSAYY